MNQPYFYETISHPPDHPIRISTEFMRRHGESLGSSVILSSGENEWKVGLNNINDGTWFDKGWKRFLDFYSVEEDYLLMFEYKGDSHFLVTIFDKSANEIVYPEIVPIEESDLDSDSSPVKPNLGLMSWRVVNGRRLRKRIPASRDSNGNCEGLSVVKGRQGRKRVSDGSCKGLSVVKGRRGRKRIFDGSCEEMLVVKSRRGRKRIPSKDSDGSCEEMSVVKRRRGRKRIPSQDSDGSCEAISVVKRRQGRKRTPSKDSDVSCEAISVAKHQRVYKRYSGRNPDGTYEDISKAPHPQSEENRLSACVRDFKSEHPIFAILTKPYHVSKNYETGVPLKFWNTYFTAKEIRGQGLWFRFRLANEEKEWPVLLKDSRGMGMFRGSGWKQLARENRLTPGEVCIFELVKDEKVFNVYRY